MSEEEIAHLRGPVLRSVSRSFYLSIRLLPAKVRDAIALAYLLARATDTIADTTEIDPEIRSSALANLAALIQDPSAPVAENPFHALAELQTNKAERILIESISECLLWLSKVSAGDREDIQTVLEKINEGQRLDLERFRNPAQIVALRTAADLEQYTYLVAGAVGEFWTKICLRHLPAFALKPREEMVSLGVEYGKGLQLVNILRDFGADLRAGRCYLPAEELHSLGLTVEELRMAPERAKQIVSAWLEKAERGLQAGVEYACALRPWRVRLATVLPALIGAQTVRAMREAGPDLFRQKIKISRAAVRRTILRTLATGASPRSLRKIFRASSSF